MDMDMSKTNVAWIICEATNLIFLLAFIIVFLMGLCISASKIKNKSDHKNLQIIRLCLVFALICQCIYPFQWIIDLDSNNKNKFYSILFHGVSALYDIIMPSVLTAIVIRMFYSYRILFYPQSNDMTSSSIPICSLIPTFIWCLSTYFFAIVQFLHFTWNHSKIYRKLFRIYCMIWAVFEALFLIQLLFILGRLQALLRSEYRYKKCLEVGRIDSNGIAEIHLDKVDRYRLMMEAMIRRMRRLIIGFSAYFVFIEGSYIWVAMEDFNNYNSFIWIIIHTTFGHLFIHATLLYYVRIRDYQEFNHKNDKWSFDIVPEKSLSGNNINNTLTVSLMNQNNTNDNMDKMILNRSLSQRNQSINGPIVAGSTSTIKQAGALLGGNVDGGDRGMTANAEDWEKYEYSYKIPIDVDKNTSVSQ